MTRKSFIEGKNVILISIKTHKEKECDILESLEELENLVNICGGKVVNKIVQNLEKSNFYNYISSSKIEELKEQIESLGCDIIVADDELTSLQLKTLRKELGIKVIGRTRMALQVFSQNSKQEDTRLIVDTVRMKYYLPLETEDKKNEIRHKMMVLNERITEINKSYENEEEYINKYKLPTISIVGYTNSGKTTLFNKLCEEEAYVSDKLISTMDPLVKKVKLTNDKHIIIEDTVGFIRKMPYNLVKLIYTQFSRIECADAIIHTIDMSDKSYKEKKQVVDDILDLLKIDKSKIIEVFNKSDIVDSSTLIKHKDDNVVSIKENINVDIILKKVESILEKEMKEFEVKIPYDKSSIIPMLYSYGANITKEITLDGIILKGSIKDKSYKLICECLNIEN